MYLPNCLTILGGGARYSTKKKTFYQLQPIAPGTWCAKYPMLLQNLNMTQSLVSFASDVLRINLIWLYSNWFQNCCKKNRRSQQSRTHPMHGLIIHCHQSRLISVLLFQLENFLTLGNNRMCVSSVYKTMETQLNWRTYTDCLKVESATPVLVGRNWNNTKVM